MTTLAQILDSLAEAGYEVDVVGPERTVDGFCSLSRLEDNKLAWIKQIRRFDPAQLDGLRNLIILSNRKSEFEHPEVTFLVSNDPKAAYFELLNRFFLEREPTLIAPSATVLTERIGQDVSIGEHCCIGPEVTIGDRVRIAPNVVIKHRVVIGDDCNIDSGTVIGTFGFGYYDTPSGAKRKVPDFGGVRIGSRVDIGANTCIDRGTLDDTVIEDDVKIDSLCQIGHNSHIGRGSLVVAMSVVSGHTVLGSNVYVAPGSTIINQVKIGDNAYIGMGSVVVKGVPADTTVFGVPAKTLWENEKEDL